MNFTEMFESYLRESALTYGLAAGLGAYHGSQDSKEKKPRYRIRTGIKKGAKLGAAVGGFGGGLVGMRYGRRLGLDYDMGAAAGLVGGAIGGGITGATHGLLYGAGRKYNHFQESAGGAAHNLMELNPRLMQRAAGATGSGPKASESATDVAFYNLMESPRARHQRFMKKAKQYSKLIADEDRDKFDPAVIAGKVLNSRGGRPAELVRKLRAARNNSN